MKKKFKLIFFGSSKHDFLTKNNYNFFSTNDSFAQNAFLCSLLRDLLAQEVSKTQHQKSNHNCLIKVKKLS